MLTQFVRFAYVMAWHVAPVMSAQKSGLIVGISSAGGVKYFADVAYCAGKAAFDKMHHDMACELREHVRWGFPISRHCLMPCLECSDASLTTTRLGTDPFLVQPQDVYSMTLYPQAGITENVSFPGGDTPSYAGRAVGALLTAGKEDMQSWTGKVVQTREVAGTCWGFPKSRHTVYCPWSSTLRSVTFTGNCCRYTRHKCTDLPRLVTVRPYIAIYSTPRETRD